MQRMFAVLLILLALLVQGGYTPGWAAKPAKKAKVQPAAKEQPAPPALEITDVDVAALKPVSAARITVFGIRLGDAKKQVVKSCAKACQWNKDDATATRDGVIYKFGAGERVAEIRLPMLFVEQVMGETRRWFSKDFANDQNERIDALQSETAVKIKETSIMGKGFSETHTLVFGDTGIELSALKVGENQFSPQYLTLKSSAAK